MEKRYWGAVATLVGTTVGAGIFGIPYVVSKAGFFTGALDIIFLCIFITIISLYLAETILRTKGNHQITGLAEIYLGRSGKFLLFLAAVLAITGALTAYIYGAGEALTAIFGGNKTLNSLFFFGVLAIIISFGIKIFEKVEELMTSGTFFIILLISIFSFFSFNTNNLTGFDITKIYVPYGVILFATLGIWTIPEMARELQDKKYLKKAVILGVSLSSFIYLIFMTSVIGVTGENTTPLATVGLGLIQGKSLLYLANLLAAFTMTTAFVSLGFALKEMYIFDYKLKKLLAWLLVIILPLLVFILNVGDFIKMMEYSAVIADAFIILCIMMMHSEAQKTGTRKPEFTLYGPAWLKLLFAILLLIGVIQLLL